MKKSVKFATALAAATAFSVAGIMGSTANPAETNQLAYWVAYFEGKGFTQVSCYKNEKVDGDKTFTAPAGAIGVIVKGGPGHIVYEGSQLGGPLTAPEGKDISHVIVCKGKTVPKPTPTPTETPEPTPTTEEPSPTETPEPTPTTEEPSPTETPEPTPTTEEPSPTETPEPTPTTEEPTPEETVTPKPTPTTVQPTPTTTKTAPAPVKSEKAKPKPVAKKHVKSPSVQQKPAPKVVHRPVPERVHTDGGQREKDTTALAGVLGSAALLTLGAAAIAARRQRETSE